MCLRRVHDGVPHVEAISAHDAVHRRPPVDVRRRRRRRPPVGGRPGALALPTMDTRQGAQGAPRYRQYLLTHPPDTTVCDEFIVSTVVSSVTPEASAVAIQHVSGPFGCHVLMVSPDNFH